MTEDFSFSPDRRSIVAYDARNTYVFDVATGELIYKAHEDSMIEAAFSDNEHIFVNTGFDIKNIAFADGTVAWSKYIMKEQSEMKVNCSKLGRTLIFLISLPSTKIRLWIL